MCTEQGQVLQSGLDLHGAVAGSGKLLGRCNVAHLVLRSVLSAVDVGLNGPCAPPCFVPQVERRSWGGERSVNAFVGAVNAVYWALAHRLFGSSHNLAQVSDDANSHM